MATFGITSGASGDALSAQRSMCTRAVLTEDGVVSKLTIQYANVGGGAANLVGFILSNATSAPGSTLYGTTNALSISAGQTGTYGDLTFADSVSLDAGTYWLGVMVNGGGSDNLRIYSAGENAAYAIYKVDTGTYPTVPTANYTLFANRWGSVIYATYELPPEPTFTGLTVTRLLNG